MSNGMAIEWEFLPVEIFIVLFSYLPRRERLSCSMVCGRWKDALNSPSLWRHMVVYLDTDLMEPSTMVLTRQYYMYIRSLEFGWSKPQMPARWLPHKLQDITKRVCRYFIVLTENYVQITSIKLHSWYELTRLKKIVYHLSLFLKSQTGLSDLCFCNALLNKSDFIKLFISCRNSESVVANLDIRSCFYNFELNLFSVQFINCLERFSNLRLLKVDYSTFRREVKQVLLGGKNRRLSKLEIYVQNDDMTPIADEEWWELSCQLRALNVALYFNNVTNIDAVLSILQRSIPLQSFSLVTAKCWHNHNHNSCCELLRILPKFYKCTLEILDVCFRDNIDIADNMLLNIISECKNLRSFKFSGVISNLDIIREMCRENVREESFNNVELSVKHMNSDDHFSIVKLYEELSKFKTTNNIHFKIHNAKFKNLLYVYY